MIQLITAVIIRLGLNADTRRAKTIRWCAASLFAFFATGVVLQGIEHISPFGLQIVATPSIPEGLYFAVDHYNDPLARGETACFFLDAPDWAIGRPYASGEISICKHIVGVPGDTVKFNGATAMLCESSGPNCKVVGVALQTDSVGRKLHPWRAEGEQRLEQGQYWVGGDVPRSFDSRYFGPIPGYRFTKTITPLWTKSATN